MTMSDDCLPIDDPRLTAYALGELDAAEAAEVERLLAESPACRAAVEEIRDLAGMLTAELQREPVPALTETQRAAITLAGAEVQQAVEHDRACREAVQPIPANQSARSPRWVKRLASLLTVGALILV